MLYNIIAYNYYMQYNDNLLEVIPNLLLHTDPLTKNYFMEVIYWITDQLPQDGFLDIILIALDHGGKIDAYKKIHKELCWGSKFILSTTQCRVT